MKGSTAHDGALFLRCHVGGDPDAAHGYFNGVDGEVADEIRRGAQAVSHSTG